jgi:hypothetical protein
MLSSAEFLLQLSINMKPVKSLLIGKVLKIAFFKKLIFYQMNSQTMLNLEMNGRRQKKMAETWQIRRGDWAWKTESIKRIFYNEF